MVSLRDRCFLTDTDLYLPETSVSTWGPGY